MVLKRLEKSYPHVGIDSESSAAVFLPVVPATDPLTEYEKLVLIHWCFH